MAFTQFTGSLQRLLYSSRRSISLIVVLACVVLYALLELMSLIGVVSREQSTFALGLSYAGVFRHMWLYQLLTAPMLHLSLLHLVFNMLTLWMLGPDIERRLGRGSYVAFSVICALSGSAGFLLFDRGAGYIMGGYSSVIFGILVAQAVYFPNRLIYIYAFFPLKMAYAVLILAAVEVALSMQPSGSWTAHSAHFFGAAAGWVFLQARGASPVRGIVRRLTNRPRRRVVRDFEREVPPRVRAISGPIGTGASPCGADAGCADAGRLTLVILNGAGSGRRFEVCDKVLTMGRSDRCDIVLSDDQRVSRVHAEIVPDCGNCAIIDAGSRNGVYVNGERTERALLRPRDKIRLGDTEIGVATDGGE